MENNESPIIWIGNSISQIDQAHIRRFALCIGLDGIPLEQRKKLVQEKTLGLKLSDGAKSWLADNEHISPALLERIVATVKVPGNEENAEALVKIVSENHGVVLFGESLRTRDWTAAEHAAQRSLIFIVIGTSAQVYPAASLPLVAKSAGAIVVEVNPIPALQDGTAEFVFAESAVEFAQRIEPFLKLNKSDSAEIF